MIASSNIQTNIKCLISYCQKAKFTSKASLVPKQAVWRTTWNRRCFIILTMYFTYRYLWPKLRTISRAYSQFHFWCSNNFFCRIMNTIFTLHALNNRQWPRPKTEKNVTTGQNKVKFFKNVDLRILVNFRKCWKDPYEC